MKVRKSRSFAKSVTWRVIALLTTFASLYLITGDIGISSAGTFLTNAINFVAYYYHERVWNSVGWGKE